MLLYCSKCRKKTDIKKPKLKKRKNNAFIKTCSVR